MKTKVLTCIMLLTSFATVASAEWAETESCIQIHFYGFTWHGFPIGIALPEFGCSR